ncbi:hypothetical protein [Saccharopolyspora phatthalungensis]|uniref:Uncharacterized protein n=1 Tax=Saccharopolyspora phatthalungensis TaxID=664693 RepID=A0A840QDM3_9PSEU|nr:hypothetical protein [Saccharopolyspora phatthalungensis]MBB5156555.1 hypothetical protein [Saccharopolyspora phatthalungensis]
MSETDQSVRPVNGARAVTSTLGRTPAGAYVIALVFDNAAPGAAV